MEKCAMKTTTILSIALLALTSGALIASEYPDDPHHMPHRITYTMLRIAECNTLNNFIMNNLPEDPYLYYDLYEKELKNCAQDKQKALGLDQAKYVDSVAKDYEGTRNYLETKRDEQIEFNKKWRWVEPKADPEIPEWQDFRRGHWERRKGS